jgi:hypothetical protein
VIITSHIYQYGILPTHSSRAAHLLDRDFRAVRTSNSSACGEKPASSCSCVSSTLPEPSHSYPLDRTNLMIPGVFTGLCYCRRATYHACTYVVFVMQARCQGSSPRLAYRMHVHRPCTVLHTNKIDHLSYLAKRSNSHRLPRMNICYTQPFHRWR